MTMEGKEYCHDLDGVKLAGQWSCSLFFKCPNQIRFWSMDTLEDIPCKCEDNDHLSERVIAVYRHGRCCKLCPRVEPKQRVFKTFWKLSTQQKKKQGKEMTHLGFTFPWIELTQRIDGRWFLHPLDRFPIVDDPNFWHAYHILDESLQPHEKDKF